MLSEVARRADPRCRFVEQTEGCREDALAVEVVATQGRGDPPARVGERRRELESARELAAVTTLAPARVVEVLTATGIVDAGRLDVGVRIDGDPDVLPRGRNDEVMNALAIGRRRAPTLLVEIAESVA